VVPIHKLIHAVLKNVFYKVVAQDADRLSVLAIMYNRCSVCQMNRRLDRP